MSVLACSRSGCDNIMCDRYSPKFGYICQECFEELCRLGVDTNIRVFMDSRVEPRIGDPIIYFDNIFPDKRY